MLKLNQIVKDYVSGSNITHALKGVSINFRRNEFVAILGPSGCGKTTLLNITGGLDRYTSGDLVIEGKSTKEYSDNDWDTYRNHSVGFIFQSYNLIMHRNILSNVELALTISGVSKEERRERAEKALTTVGLGGLGKKKPNQLSGGQMQRVAIARALVNNPEILLADEPTGALDSETSVQIMDLLKEVAKDRLVIMVTHNPDLAYKYANRIIKMKDGVVFDDSNPYNGESLEERNKHISNKVVNKGNKRKTSMSFFTAGGLSLTNLVSKLKRTVLVSIAGSIGIMGISAVLAVKHGVDNYIDSMQEEMLSQYPVEITEQAVDYTSLMSGLSSWSGKIEHISFKDAIGVNSMIKYLMETYKDLTSIKTNEINEELLGYIENLPEEYRTQISYNYGIDITNNIFTNWNRKKGDPLTQISLNGLTRMYIAELKTVEGFDQYATFVDLFTNFMRQLPAGEDYISNQYDCLAGSFPKNDDELMVVVDANTALTDIIFAQLGFFNEEEFINLANKAVKENDEDVDKSELEQYVYPDHFSYEDVLKKDFYYYPQNKIWQYGDVYSTNIFNISATLDYAGQEAELTATYDENQDTLKAVLPIQGSTITLDFTRSSETPKGDKFEVGTWENSMVNIEIFDKIDLEGNIGSLNITMTGYEQSMPIKNYNIGSPFKQSVKGYNYSATNENSCDWGEPKKMKISGIYRMKEGSNFGCLTRGIYYTPALTKTFIDDSLNANFLNDVVYGLKSIIDNGEMTDFKAYVSYRYTSFKTGSADNGDNYGYAYAVNGAGASSMSQLFGGGSATSTKYSTTVRTMTGLAVKPHTNKDESISYTYEAIPNYIDFYPKSFDDKDSLTNYLDQWNEDVKLSYSYYKDEAGRISKTKQTDGSRFIKKDLLLEDRAELTYTDAIELIISLIKTLIDAISIALIVFTSLSLVVSCFMIAVITYISTMERVKEIGVIRSLGGRKKDVSLLFISECFMIGLASGIIGIVLTLGISALINTIVLQYGVTNIAALPIYSALIMVGLSIILNILSGLIPSMQASKQDPVVALRTE